MQIHNDGLAKLRTLVFINDDTLLGRIAYSFQAVNQVSIRLQKISSIEMVTMDFKGKESFSIFGFKVYDGVDVDFDIPIASTSANVQSPYALGAPVAFKTFTGVSNH